MIKKYLFSEDQYSGQVVIICDSHKEEFRECLNPDQVHYLYDEPLYRYYTDTVYEVRVYYHYELGENEDNELFNKWTTDKNEANEYFKQALIFCK